MAYSTGRPVKYAIQNSIIFTESQTTTVTDKRMVETPIEDLAYEKPKREYVAFFGPVCVLSNAGLKFTQATREDTGQPIG